MMAVKSQRTAVIGSGIAGASIAYALTQAGHAVHLFDKSRGPAGRLATRRVEWTDRLGKATTTRLDHGAPGFTARTPTFKSFVGHGLQAGWLAEWTPRLSESGVVWEDGGEWVVPTPDMPALCRHLVAGIPATWSFAVDGLSKGPLGWQVQAGAERHASPFDAVVLALPPAQAAPLLNPHRPDWARDASPTAMQPCWTLMGITDDPSPALAWDVARPTAGPLAWVLRNDSRPGRACLPGQAHWVVHARADWSREHLDTPAAWVQQHLQTAVAACLGRPVDWHHALVHRWRYALPPAGKAAPTASCWWDPEQGLGVCGDFLGGCGVEGAWLSAQALSAALMHTAHDGGVLNHD